MAAAVAARRGGNVRFVALDTQHARIERELKEAFARLLDSSAFTLGAEVEQFEAEFAEYCGVPALRRRRLRHGRAVARCCEAAGIGPGDEVIVPAHTFIASALAVATSGATPVLCDVDEGTGLIDPDAAPRPPSGRARRRSSPSTSTARPATWTRSTRSPSRGACSCSRTRPRRTARTTEGRRAGSLGAAAAFSLLSEQEPRRARRRRRGLHRRRRARRARAPAAQPRPAGEGRARRARLQRAARRPPGRAAAGQAGRTSTSGTRRAGRRAARYRELLGRASRLLEERPESPCVYHLFPARFENRDAVAACAGWKPGSRPASTTAPPCTASARATSGRRRQRRGAAPRRPGRRRSSRCRCTRT